MIKDITQWACANGIAAEVRKLLNSPDSGKYSVVNIFGAEEFELQFRWAQTKEGKLLQRFAKTHQVNFVHGCFDSPAFRQQCAVTKGTNSYSWPTFWATFTLACLYNEIPEYSLSSLQTGFTSLNHRAHPHRCEMMDILAKHNLIKNNDISWHNPEVDYAWKHWEPQLLRIEAIPESPDFRLGAPVTSFKHTFCSLVSESTPSLHFITEKTWPHLFLQRPFLIAGAPGIHQCLSNLGFKMYDEIFDYSFDAEPDQTKRYEMIAKNLEQLQRLNLHKARAKIFPKLKYNQNLAISIATDVSRVPKIVLDLINRTPTHSYAATWSVIAEICSQDSALGVTK
jgi:hypothetical protein